MIKRRLAFILAVVMGLGAFGRIAFGKEEYQAARLLIDGEEYSGDAPAVIYNERAVLPLRVISEAFGWDVFWDGEAKSAELVADDAEKYIFIMGVDWDIQEMRLYFSVGSETVRGVMGMKREILSWRLRQLL